MKQTLIHDDRLRGQLDFLIEIDRLKQVLRRAFLPGTERNAVSYTHLVCIRDRLSAVRRTFRSASHFPQCVALSM